MGDGPVSRVPRTSRVRKASCKTAIHLFWKADLLTCFNVWIKMAAKFDGFEPRRCEDITGIVAPEIGPRNFWTFEKLVYLTEWSREQQPRPMWSIDPRLSWSHPCTTKCPLKLWRFPLWRQHKNLTVRADLCAKSFHFYKRYDGLLRPFSCRLFIPCWLLFFASINRCSTEKTLTWKRWQKSGRDATRSGKWWWRKR